MVKKVSSRALGVVLLLVGIIVIGGATGIIPLAIACGPGNNCSVNTYIESIQFGNTVLGSSTVSPVTTSVVSGPVTVDYYVPSGESLASWTLVWCRTLVSDACGSGAASIPLTQSNGALVGSWTATSAGGVYFFYATVTDSDGYTANLYGSLEVSASAPTGTLFISAIPSTATVQFYQSGTQVATETGQTSIVLPTGSYTWTATATGYYVDQGSVTVNTGTIDALSITMEANSSPATVTSSVSSSDGTTVTAVSTISNGGTTIQYTTVISTSTTYETMTSSTVITATTSNTGHSSTKSSVIQGDPLVIGIVLLAVGFALIVSKKKEFNV